MIDCDLNEIELVSKAEKAWNGIIIKLKPNIVVLNQYVRILIHSNNFMRGIAFYKKYLVF